MNDKVRVRFAPSPTGYLHLGGLRTALYNYLLAKKYNGTFILRIEDTDQTRFVEGSVDNLINSLVSLGIDFDEGPYKESDCGPYFQSQRLEIYHKYVNQLIEQGDAYYCFCTKEELDTMRAEQQANKLTTKYNGKCRNLSKEQVKQKLADNEPYVVRMKIPDDKIFNFNDLIRGQVEIASELVEDQVILKADGFPTYHLAAVVDDHLMEISHVLRGEEWLYSTPKHIFLYEAFKWETPKWVHLPLLLNTDRSKLSKRHGDFSVKNYLNKGYLKEAIINFVALLGWHAAEDRELYTLDDLSEEFSIERISKSGAIFDITKLDWMNGWYIRNLDIAYIGELCKPYFDDEDIDISNKQKYHKVLVRARDQITNLTQITEHSRMFYNDIQLSNEFLEIVNSEDSQKVLNWYLERLNQIDLNSWIKENLTVISKEGIKETGIKGKNYFFPIRLALFGDCHGPDIPMLLDILGKEETINRLKKFVI
ncbi:MAG: glutamate--tRNA ligase [Candidatus Cloacimonetes bacterium]|nr:glutamate--tRNA ligase [Candidatus Cloacimonadota bacterium]